MTVLEMWISLVKDHKYDINKVPIKYREDVRNVL